MLHIRRYTPLPGLMLNAFPCLILVYLGQIDLLIDAFGFVSWTFIGLVSAAVLILRRKMPNLSRPYKVRDIITLCLRRSKVFLNKALQKHWCVFTELIMSMVKMAQLVEQQRQPPPKLFEMRF